MADGRADIGLIGLAVMGENLVLNLESRGFRVAVYNRTVEKVDAFVAGRAKGKNVVGTRSIAELVAALSVPRRVMLMVKAGAAVDGLIDALVPHLSPGDVLIDGGNSRFEDSARRAGELEARGFLYVGAGVSGGEEGALLGPSIMPGGSAAAWPLVAPLLRAIAARAPDGTPCCDWVGSDGAGHFVKMVHNGIEYGDLQLLGEAYHLMSHLLGMEAAAMSGVFDRWSRGDLDSYLVEVTRDVLAVRDADGRPLVDAILDVAGQKGTGRWTSATALELGVPLGLIDAAVSGRFLSTLKEERVAAAKLLPGPAPSFSGDPAAFVDDLGKALFASKLVSYAQGFALMRAASESRGWGLRYGGIALLWRAGCIIRSAFLDRVKEAFDAQPALPNLLLDPWFRGKVGEAQDAWRRVVSAAALSGVWAPGLSTALAWYDGYRSARLPANLLQAQRDYFGAHQYERVDSPRGELFHTDWTGARDGEGSPPGRG